MYQHVRNTIVLAREKRDGKMEEKKGVDIDLLPSIGTPHLNFLENMNLFELPLRRFSIAIFLPQTYYCLPLRTEGSSRQYLIYETWPTVIQSHSLRPHSMATQSAASIKQNCRKVVCIGRNYALAHIHSNAIQTC
jgi:hypothetical protein